LAFYICIAGFCLSGLAWAIEKLSSSRNSTKQYDGWFESVKTWAIRMAIAWAANALLTGYYKIHYEGFWGSINAWFNSGRAFLIVCIGALIQLALYVCIGGFGLSSYFWVTERLLEKKKKEQGTGASSADQ
jgi:hypothetical protein